MATGPQKYPGASTAYWWQKTWGGDLMEVNTCVLHTTEGVGLPNYDGGSMAPNLTAVADMTAKRLRWHQHFDIDRSSRALRNLAGGVQTNTLNVTQVELDGTCDYSKRERWGNRTAGKDYIYWGNPPDWALRDLAELLRWINANHGVPLTGPSMWLTYGPDSRRAGITPASYGASPARMSFSQWTNFRGICGHQHVPENDHGDPGSLPFTKLIALAKEGTDQKDPGQSGGTPTKNAPATPEVSLAKLVAAARSNPAAKGTPVTYAGVRTVEAALVAEGLLAKGRLDGHYGSDTVKAYSRWQLKLYPGASTKPGGAADGIPGKDSLTKLGKKHGFTVTA
ncbi:peptidoglycan-binding domain-containing protein [Streptomyces sp. NPDC017179]|uniref:peptidoglycan-binding domain-containing protein n=1 Tax=Streptomyces sp. NPDC017179 TaxID=3364979 RepID=UPI00378D3BA2